METTALSTVAGSTFEPVESSIAVLADYIGPHKIMWATDYPHSDGFFPGRAADAQRAARAAVRRGEAPGARRRCPRLLRPELTLGRHRGQEPPGQPWSG